MTTYRWGRWALVAVFAMGASSGPAVCGEQDKAVPPFQTFERFAPVSVKEPAAGVFLCSFEQNSSAQLRIELAGGKPGDVGHVYLIRALAETGRSDVLHRVYARDGPGSYGGILKKGLTALPETWDAVMDGRQSLNHCMLGHVLEWYYGYVAGIRQKTGTVGWKDIVIAPHPGPLTHAEATLTIPAGTTATAILPSGATKPLRLGLNHLAEPWK